MTHCWSLGGGWGSLLGLRSMIIFLMCSFDDTKLKFQVWNKSDMFELNYDDICWIKMCWDWTGQIGGSGIRSGIGSGIGLEIGSGIRSGFGLGIGSGIGLGIRSGGRLIWRSAKANKLTLFQGSWQDLCTKFGCPRTLRGHSHWEGGLIALSCDCW